MSNVKRQHYVWRHYLREWAPEDQIWCNRQGKVFRSELMGVAQERFFYHQPVLSNDEFEFFRKFAQSLSSVYTKESANSIIELVDSLGQVSAICEANPILDGALKNHLENFQNSAIEKIHGHIEGNAIYSLSCVRKLDHSFLENDEHAVDFFNFICSQFMRTKAKRENFKKAFDNYPYPLPDTNKMWPSLSIIVARQLAVGMMGHRKPFCFHFLKNNTDMNFITSDQPVINIYAEDVALKDPVSKLAFYFPISPKTAVILSNEINESTISSITSPSEVGRYNHMMLKESHEQFYGINKADVDVPFFLRSPR